jgi:peptidoglycan-associated lipoprotein
MFNQKVSQSLRMLLLVLGVGLMLSVSGCSSWHRAKKGTEVAPPQVAAPAQPEVPANAPAEGPRPGDLKEFPADSGVADIHFDYDKSNIKSNQLAILDKNLAYFKAHPDVKIMIEGHCDERGTTEYNFALGQRRAAAVQEYLQKNGIAADRLATISKGKDQPIDPAHNEAAFAKNRRAHFMRMY